MGQLRERDDAFRPHHLGLWNCCSRGSFPSGVARRGGPGNLVLRRLHLLGRRRRPACSHPRRGRVGSALGGSDPGVGADRGWAHVLGGDRLRWNCHGRQHGSHSYENDSEGFTTGRLTLRRGPFAPGLTPESGASEIEVLTFAREEDRRAQNRRHARGRSLPCWAAERHRMGEPDPNAEGASPDPDLRLPDSFRPPVGFKMGRGDDTLTANGGPEFDGPLGARLLLVTLGRGVDYYRGAHSRAWVFAGRGADTIVTGRRTDIVSVNAATIRSAPEVTAMESLAVGGRDRVWTGGGNDIVIAKDGRRDRVRCGPGLDRAALDARDRARSCEREFELSSRAAGSKLPRAPVLRRYLR